jgi:hypothetical protein
MFLLDCCHNPRSGLIKINKLDYNFLKMGNTTNNKIEYEVKISILTKDDPYIKNIESQRITNQVYGSTPITPAFNTVKLY